MDSNAAQCCTLNEEAPMTTKPTRALGDGATGDIDNPAASLLDAPEKLGSPDEQAAAELKAQQEEKNNG